jgi:hypothetical protein
VTADTPSCSASGRGQKILKEISGLGKIFRAFHKAMDAARRQLRKIDSGPLVVHPNLPVVGHEVGVGADSRDASGGRRGSAREGEDGAGHERADGANREDGRG